MLCNVLALSLPAIQLLANKEEPKGLPPPMRLLRWGIEPALRRDSSAWLLALEAPAVACESVYGVADPYTLPGGVF